MGNFIFYLLLLKDSKGCMEGEAGEKGEQEEMFRGMPLCDV